VISAGRKPVIVSLTPLPLSADSRTLKQVTSVHRFGFESIVIEGKESGFAPGVLPFEVRSIRAQANAGASSARNAKSDTSKSVVDVCPQATEALSFPGLRQSSLLRLAVRYVPGCKIAVWAFRRTLDRAIVARRGSNQASSLASTGEMVAACPRALAYLLFAVARFALSIPLSRIVSSMAHPRAFAGHLALYLKQYFFQVLSVTPRADVYYLHAFYQFPAVFLLCLRYRAKMIYDAHDFYSQLEDDASFSSYWKNWVLPFEQMVERICVWFASDVVTVNEGIAALMRERFSCEPAILRNAHDPRLDRIPATTIREHIGVPPGTFLVVSIGNWKKGMAMEQMLDALAALPKHVHLAFLGSGYSSLDEAIASRSLGGRVHLVKPVLPQEIVPFIVSADASVVLYYGKSVNYQNALPNRFFQSIAAKLPLVYPDLNEIRRLADQYGVGIMADPQQPAEIESAISTLIEDAHRRDEIRNNLLVASRELSWEREEQLLGRLLNRHLGRAELPLPNVRNPAAG
jgi:glycosyltransferase involved in cell wall biosynthesis